MKLDKKDTRLLNLLSENARYSYAELAKNLEISRELTTYRMNRLVQQGVLEGCVALIKPQNMGLLKHTVYLRFQKIGEHDERKIVEELKKNPNINWIVSLGGAYDLAIEIVCDSMTQCNDVLSSVVDICGKGLRTYAILNTLDERPVPFNLFGEQIDDVRLSKNTNKLTIGSTQSVKVDEQDLTIMNELASDARKSAVDLARKTGLSANTVSNRIKRLVKSDVISQFVAVPSYEKLGLTWNVVLMRFTNFTPAEEKKFLYYVQKHPYMDYYAKFVGVWNYQVSFLSKNASHLRQMLLELREQFGDVLQEYEVVTVFNQHKYECVINGDHDE